jgi:hypothetical protein
MSNGVPFTPNTEQTAIAIAYRNRQMIADLVCPRAPVGQQQFKYMEFDPAETMTEVNTYIGRKSAPNQVEFSAKEKTESVSDHGLSDVVPNDDVANAPANYNPLNHATESITDLIELGREVRVAKMFSTPENYGYKQSLAANGLKKITDPDCNIFELLNEMLERPLMRPNSIVLNSFVATKIRMNSSLLKGYNGSVADTGMVPWEYIKDTFELQNIYVGQARVNTKKKGQEMEVASTWGNFISLPYIDPLANTNNNRMTFALTAQYGDRISGNRDVSAGIRGGVEVMVGESVKELIIAKQAAILLTDVV